MTFNPTRLKISFFIPEITMQNKKMQTLEEMAACRLNCKEYEETYSIYKKILVCQKNFNDKMNEFLNKTQNHLKPVVSSNDEQKIELLLRYYLYKIADENSRPCSQGYRLTHLDKANFDGKEVQNPFPGFENDIIEDLKKRYTDKANSINEFQNRIKILYQHISEFQKSLSRIVANEIKGVCSKENQLNFTTRFKSKFSRHKHSV
jgi:hypothetical protein